MTTTYAQQKQIGMLNASLKHFKCNDAIRMMDPGARAALITDWLTVQLRLPPNEVRLIGMKIDRAVDEIERMDER